MALPVVLLIGSCFSRYERVTEEEEVGFQGRAAYDPLLAAELLFGELGLPMERPASWQDLPPVEHTILLPSHSLRSPVPAERLLGWVRDGGHLIVSGGLGGLELWPQGGGEAQEGSEDGEEGEDAQEPEDPLLHPLGLEIVRNPAADGDSDGDEEDEPESLTMDRGPRQVHIGQRVRASEGIEVDLRVPEPEGAEDRHHSLVRIAVGRGWVTALSDTIFLSNSEIGDRDHAAFAWDVVAPPHRIPEGLAVFLRTGYPPWFEVLTRFAWKALLSGALALALFLWSRGSRFGPISGTVAPERRSLLEHVSASGEFLWRTRVGEVLLHSTRASVLREATRRDPLLARLPENEKIRHMAAKAGLSGGQLASALENRSVEDPTEFLRIVTTLETVRRSSGTAPPRTPSGDDDDLA